LGYGRMAEWPTWSRTQEIFKKESTYYGQADQAKDKSRATGKRRHYVTCSLWIY